MASAVIAWLVLADDLTGAADAGAAFARAGRRTEVAWQVAAMTRGVEVRCVDLDTRARDAAAAAARHHAAVLSGLAPGQALFKKMDSTLRGHPAAEIAAISRALRELGRASWALLAPANPAMGRTTRDGRVFVAGVPLEETKTWKREHRERAADLCAMVRAAGMRPIKLPLAQVRGDRATLVDALAEAAASEHSGGPVLVCDAETTQDLERIVAAARDAQPGFYAGTAGLANALAGPHAGVSAAPGLPASSHGTLVAVGTLACVSRIAVEKLARVTGTELLRIDPAEPRPSAQAEVRLRRGEPVLARLDAPDTGGPPDPDQVRAFAAALDSALRHMGALVVTGGETAAALLARCRVRSIHLLGEIEPGVALGVTRGAIEVPIATKPGAFGDEDSLVRCLQRMNQLRQSA